MRRAQGQTDLLGEIIVDSFADGSGCGPGKLAGVVQRADRANHERTGERGGRMRDAMPIPEDFGRIAEVASTKRLADLYGISVDTVRRWRKKLGIPSPKPPPRAFRGMDSPAVIQICLTCPRRQCNTGFCELVRLARLEETTQMVAVRYEGATK